MTYVETKIFNFNFNILLFIILDERIRYYIHMPYHDVIF